MQRIGRIDRQGAEVETLEDAQRDERRDALAVGRELVHVVAAVALVDRRDPCGLVVAQVLRGQCAAAGMRMRGEALGERAFVEVAAVRLADAAQRGGRIAQDELLAYFGRAAGWHERLRVAGLAVQLGDGRRPLVRDDGGDGVAAFRDLGRRFQHVGERQPAETLVQGRPGRDGARHRHRIPAARGAPGVAVGVFAVLAAEVVEAPAARRGTRCIEAVQALAVPQDGEGIAAQAARYRLDDGQHGRRRDRRIGRAAPGQ